MWRAEGGGSRQSAMSGCVCADDWNGGGGDRDGDGGGARDVAVWVCEICVGARSGFEG